MDAHIAAVAEARIGNVNHLSKPATLDYSCISLNSVLQITPSHKTITSQEKSKDNCCFKELGLAGISYLDSDQF